LPGREAGFVGRAVELERLRSAAEPRGLRSVPVMVGPSGIGKTRLARRLAEAYDRGGYMPVYVRFNRVVRDKDDLAWVLRRELEDWRSRLKGILAGLTRKVVKRSLGADAAPAGERIVLGVIRGLLDVDLESLVMGTREPFEVVNGLLASIARRAESEGLHAVVVIDEAQNLVKGIDAETWGFIKTLSSLQEDHPGAFQSLLITSDYSFQRRLYREAPSLDYLETFYLGEMVETDAATLARAASGEQERLQGAMLEAVGGHPYHVRSVLGAENPPAVYRRLLRKYRQKVAEVLHVSHSRQLREMLEALLHGPIRVEEYLAAPRAGAADELIRSGVLQFACSDYTGIYQWNQAGDGCSEERCGGGGLCGGLDVVAPSSRVALAALAEALWPGEEPSRATSPVPEWLPEALRLAR